MTTFGGAMRAHRDRLGLSLTKMAALVDCDAGYLNKLEIGERAPSRNLIEQFIGHLDLTEDQANALRTTAGFVAPGALYVSRPVLAEIDSLLSADALPDSIATPVRQQLASIARTLSAVIGAD